MSKISKINLESLAEEIVADVDYDIFKEDLEEREIINTVYQRLLNLIEEAGVAICEEDEEEL